MSFVRRSLGLIPNFFWKYKQKSFLSDTFNFLRSSRKAHKMGTPHSKVAWFTSYLFGDRRAGLGDRDDLLLLDRDDLHYSIREQNHKRQEKMKNSL